MKTKTRNILIGFVVALTIGALWMTTPTECTHSGSVPKYCVD
ncbi:hypothetical protein [Xanthomonas phage X1]|nr:hypothetical protein [Xanthomonas phage X1]